MERWAGIVRVSYMGGRIAGAENVHADRDQVTDIQRHADTHGARVEFLAPELNVSGGLPLERRPSLLAAIEGVERGEYDAVIVSYLSRLGRNIREQLKAWDRVEAAGGRIIVVRENIDSSTASGRMQRNILLAMAEHEREQHVERFTRLAGWATEAGIWQRRQTPLGYTRDPQTRKLVPNDDAERVRRAFADRIAGKPTLEIARELGMTTSGVRALLRNRVYLGELRIGEFVNLAAHPPLVSEDVFQQAQTARVTRPLRVRREPALLRGLVYCAGCQHIMSSSAQKVITYACHRHHSAGSCPAPAAITGRILDEHVKAIALHELSVWSARAILASTHGADARFELERAEAELAAFLRGVQAAGIAVEQFAQSARERQRAIDVARLALHDRLAEQPARTISGDPVVAWDAMDGGQRNRLLGGLFEGVLVARAGGRGHVVPVAVRVRVVKRGAGVIDTRRYRGVARPIVSVRFAELDDECVAGV